MTSQTILQAESSIERNVCAYAEDTYHYLSIKLTSGNSRSGLPDRLFIGKRKSIFFVEFKAPGETPGKLQLYYHKLIRLMGFKVYVVDDEEKGKKIIDKEYRAQKKSRRAGSQR